MKIQKDQKDQKDQKEPEGARSQFSSCEAPATGAPGMRQRSPGPLTGLAAAVLETGELQRFGCDAAAGPATVPVSPCFAPGAADRWRMPGAPAAGFGSEVCLTTSSRAQACARAARPDQSRRREARKNRWCHWRYRLRQSHARAARLLPVLSTAAAHPEGGCGLGRVAWAHACAQAQGLAIHPARTGPRVHHTRRAS